MKTLETVGRWLTFLSACMAALASTLATVFVAMSFNAMWRIIRDAGGTAPVWQDMIPAVLMMMGLTMISAIIWVIALRKRPWALEAPAPEEEDAS